MAALLFGCVASPAFAHRQDEYLQATLVSVRRDRITFYIRMTPGVEAAPKVLAAIDSDGDRTFSSSEKQAYAERVRGDLSATVDGRRLTLRLAASSFPPVEDFLAGTGDVQLQFDADPSTGPVSRRLVLDNRHQVATSVYLVNCVLPRDPSIRIVGQERNVSQSRYQLDFEIDGSSAVDKPAPIESLSPPVEAPNGAAVAKTYFVHGVRHILIGYDHLLFLSALVLAATTFWELLKVVTAFTIAHSVTLTLASLGLVRLPESVVEPVIAGSIVFVALQNLLWPGSSRGRARLAVAFLFGLFHGLGFAAGLLELMHAMPKSTALAAILGFSFGVEAGHLLVLVPLFAFLTGVRRFRSGESGISPIAHRIQSLGSATILLAGAYYLWMSL